MFKHRKIMNSIVNENWSTLRKTISPAAAYRAAELIGEYSAADMLEFASLRDSDVSSFFVKYRDGLPMASGMRRIIPEADVIYIVTERYGPYNSEVRIWPLDGEKIEGRFKNNITWFADPINARGTTAIEVLRYLQNSIPFETALFSHIVANDVGIGAVQTHITDFQIDSYMNYAFLSKKINQENGYLQDALEIIPDFGDKISGTIGADYSLHQMQKDLWDLLGTKAGAIEKLKGIVVFLLLKHGSGQYGAERKVTWSTRRWIKETILWYIALRDVQINSNIVQNFDIIMNDLEERGFIYHRKIPYKKGFARLYSLTSAGINTSSAVYLPILDRLGICRIILKDFDFLVHLRPDEIRDARKESHTISS
jgi:uracil phosphoribosyltransferase